VFAVASPLPFDIAGQVLGFELAALADKHVPQPPLVDFLDQRLAADIESPAGLMLADQKALNHLTYSRDPPAAN
jgi:hypothetical protein